MKLYLLSICLSLTLALPAQSRYNIIPKPFSVSESPGSFRYPGTNIHFDEGLGQAAELLATALHIPASRVKPLTRAINGNGNILIRKISAAAADSEAYRLRITESSVEVAASHPNGAIYAVQSLAQLAATNPGGTLPCGNISDRPRFGYRGMMLDVSRNFFPPEYIKKTLDLMSLYKLNRFHWHLTDGPGWRLQIRKYPELTSKAAWRTHNTWKEWWVKGRQYSEEGLPSAYGGYYTQDQVRDIVAYASRLGITIIPEIEMPGHSDEVMATYPHMQCQGVKGVPGELCIGNDSTFIFMQDVLNEVMELFPSVYLHIGGDEADKRNWKACARCQKRMKENTLKDEFELQSYAIRRMEKFISSKGRKLLGWDEILEGGLAPGSTVMSWRGEQGGIDAANMGHDVVMTPNNYCYFDYYQQDPSTQPEAIGGYINLQKVYQWDPVPAVLETSKHKHILGAQANVWTEYIATREYLEYMIFPRLLALSEVAWTDKSRNWDEFKARLNRNYTILQKHSINYCRPSDKVELQPQFSNDMKTAIVHMNTEQHMPEIRYTLDGTEPSSASTRYIAPFPLDKSAAVRASVIRNGKAMTVDSLTIDFHKALGKSVAYHKPWQENYPAQKETTLVNGVRGSLTYQDKQWQGFLTDVDLTIDLGSVQDLSSLSAGFMQIIGPGIFMPHYIEVSVSEDGRQFGNAKKAMNDISESDKSLRFKTFSVNLQGQRGRYIRFFAKNQRGFQFIDEVIVY